MKIIANLLIDFFPSRHFNTFYTYYFKSGTTIDILYTRKLKIEELNALLKPTQWCGIRNMIQTNVAVITLMPNLISWIKINI